MLFDLFWPKTLDFDDESLRAFMMARILAGFEGKKQVTPLDIFRGLVSTGLPESRKFSAFIGIGYSDDVAALKKAYPPEAWPKLAAEVGVSSPVKKILARATQTAVRGKSEKVSFKHFACGLLEERPMEVLKDLKFMGRDWSILERYEKEG